MSAKSGRKDCRNQRPMSLNIELGGKIISAAESAISPKLSSICGRLGSTSFTRCLPFKSRSQCSGQFDTHMNTACSDWSKRVIVGTKEMGVQTGTTYFKIQKEHFMILVGTR
jgi:hypothetical protein